MRSRGSRTSRRTAFRLRLRTATSGAFRASTARPFRYRTPADVYLERARRYAQVPVKQAIISPSALSLLYPQSGIDGYSRQEYLDDLLDEQEDGDPALPAERRTRRPDRFHGRAACGQARRFAAASGELHRFEQPVDRAFFRRGAKADRRAFLSRRRPALHPQRGCRLCRAAAELVPAAGGQFLPATGQRTRSQAGADSHPGSFQGRTTHFRGRDRFPSLPGWRAPKRSATVCSKRPSTSRRTGWAPPTIADLLPSATIPRVRAKRRSRRSAPALRGRRSRPRCLASRSSGVRK